MKKSIKVVICLISIFMLFGCRISSNSTINNITDTNESIDPLEKFVEENKASIEKLSNSLLNVTLEARDGSLVYSYTYKTTYDESTKKTMKSSLESTMDSQSYSFNTVLDSVREVAPDTKSVLVEYLNGDGTLIANIEFK